MNPKFLKFSPLAVMLVVASNEALAADAPPKSSKPPIAAPTKESGVKQKAAPAESVSPVGESPVTPPLATAPAIEPVPPVEPGDPVVKAQKAGAASGDATNDLLNVSVAVDPSSGADLPLAGISLFVDHRKKATESAATWEKEQKNALKAGVQITDGLMTPDPGGLRSKLEKFIGKTPTTYASLQEMVAIISDHYLKNHRPMTHVYIPKQSLYSDRVVLSIVEGRVGETRILAEADLVKKPQDQLTKSEKGFLDRMQEQKTWWNSWYNNPYQAKDVSSEYLLRSSQLKGRIVDTEEIEALITGINRSPWVRLNRPVEHPFRDVRVSFEQPATDVVGTTDLVFGVDDKRPLKFFTGVDNTLTEMTGENRFFLGAAWYDAFLLGRNHQLGAQIFSALDPDELIGFSVNYSIPWQDQRFDQFTELFASYADSRAEVMLGGIPSDSTGASIIFGGRHYLELPELLGATELTQPLMDKRPYQWAKPEREAMGLHHEVGAGFDFKSSDNNLEFGGSTVAESPADIVQLVLEYNARQTDPTGETSLTTQLYISPGDLTGDNSDEAFNPLRLDAQAAYVYTRLRLEREQDLPFTGNLGGMMLHGALTGQYASSNLLASEQLGLGGFSSVRGYPERALRGDLGIVCNLELFSPEFHPANDWFKFKTTDTLRFLMFVDYAHGESVDENAADPLDDAADLISAGVGVRYEYDDTLRLRLDYGFRLEDLPAAADNTDNGAAHFGLIYVF